MRFGESACHRERANKEAASVADLADQCLTLRAIPRKCPQSKKNDEVASKRFGVPKPSGKNCPSPVGLCQHTGRERGFGMATIAVEHIECTDGATEKPRPIRPVSA